MAYGIRRGIHIVERPIDKEKVGPVEQEENSRADRIEALCDILKRKEKKERNFKGYEDE